MSITSRCGLIKGVMHANHPALDQTQLMRKINGKTLEMNVNDENCSCATWKGKFYEDKK